MHISEKTGTCLPLTSCGVILPVFLTPAMFPALVSYILLNSSFHRFRSSRIHLLGEGREQPDPERQRHVHRMIHSLSRMSFLPDEAGPGVAAGVAKVDDQGKVAVVDGDLGETNDASDALLLSQCLLACCLMW
jgi:hypothetical protein